MRNSRNYKLLVALSALQGFVFYAPVATVYRQAYGLSLSGLFLIESISWILTIILEVPFGAFADRFGCRRTVVLGSVAFFASKVIFSAAYGFTLFLLERVVLSVSLAALSGANETLLSLSIDEDDAEGRFGLWNASGRAAVLAASLLAPLLYSVSLRLTAYATSVAYGLAMVASFFLEEPAEGSRRSGAVSFAALGAAFRSLASDRSLLAFLMAMAVSGEAAQASTVFLSQPLYVRAGIGSGWYGLLYAFLQGSALSAAFAGRVSRRLGRRRALRALLAVQCGCAAVLAAVSSPFWTFAALALTSAAAALIRPISTVVQLGRIRIPERATALSLNAMVQELVGACVNAAAGCVVEKSLAFGVWTLAGMLALTLAFSPWALRAAENASDGADTA